jgi:hypothetical protein
MIQKAIFIALIGSKIIFATEPLKRAFQIYRKKQINLFMGSPEQQKNITGS